MEYWNGGNRLDILKEKINKGMKNIVIVPVGRKRFLEMTMQHVFSSRLADEIHLWYNPRSQEDVDYIKSIPTMDGRVKIIEIPGQYMGKWSINDFYKHDAMDENAIYLKIDDDVIWFEDGGIDKVLQFRKEHPEWFVVSPLPINNGVGAFMLKDKIKFHPIKESVLIGESKAENIHHCQFYTRPGMGKKCHEFLLDHIDRLDELRVPNRITDTRFSINAISWFGVDFKNLGLDFTDDEQNITIDFPRKVGLKNCIMGNVLCAHYAFGPQLAGIDGTDILDRYRQLPLPPPRKNTTKRTAVLFMCHVIDDEAKFRYELLRKGCKEMGYDLLWAIDTMAIPEENLPKDGDIDFYPISYLRYEKLFPYMTFIEDENRMDEKRHLNSPFLAYHLFVNDNPDKYDRIWLVEFDVCCYGEWGEFFKKHEEDSSALLSPSVWYGSRPNRWTWDRTTEHLKRFPYNGCLSWTLLCACRVDTSLHQKVCEFFQKLPEDDNSRHRLHMEIAWPTVARMNGLSTGAFLTNQFNACPPLTYEFNDYHEGRLYHPLKLDIEWKRILARRQSQLDANAKKREIEPRTAVLFICHIVNDETLYRYWHLREGCDQMGYDLFWALDNEGLKPQLPNGVDTYCFTVDRFADEFPYIVYRGRRNIGQNACIAPVYLMYKDNKDKYDYVWYVEYDACCYGGWDKFFMKYASDKSSLIMSSSSFCTYDEFPEWCGWTPIDRSTFNQLKQENCLCEGLICCSRMSMDLIGEVVKFCDEFKGDDKFFEWVFPTVAKRINGGISLFNSGYFMYRPQITSEYTEYVVGKVYHPVKLNMSWKNTHNWVH